MYLRFSTVQQKELIEVGSGIFLGFIVDAFVDKDSGEITYFLVEPPKKFYQIFQGEADVKKVYFHQIVTIGQDVVLIRSDQG